MTHYWVLSESTHVGQWGSLAGGWGGCGTTEGNSDDDDRQCRRRGRGVLNL